MSSNNYEKIRVTVAEALERAADAHERGDWAALRAGYDGIDNLLDRGSDERLAKLHVALYFWDSWIDSSNHHWRYHEPLIADDWPALAREIAKALRIDQEISNPRILRLFER